ncbi:hypothetical protein [Pseudomonas sp. dw_358]|uniref:hypothetical protein n=1 Tax=Pseudomonas sp. dw_358 TaxID=2720083 RepID=UPI001BD2F41D|nr:hypothetical protein [Pseudomonas sp. dw_358]
MSRLPVAALLGLGLALTAPLALAQTHPHPRHHAKSAAPVETGPKVSTLNGKFSFTLPKSYTAEAMAPGDVQSGTAGSSGTMYSSEKSKRVVIATQVPVPAGVSVGDKDFLDKATADYVADQTKAAPDFKQTASQKLTLKKLPTSRVDSTATMGGGPTLVTSFIAGSGKTLSVVQIISRADDKAGHAAMIKRVMEGR